MEATQPHPPTPAPRPVTASAFEMSPTVGGFAGALAKAQSEMVALTFNKTAQIKTTKGYTYSFQYATLAAVFEITRALNKNDIAIIQAPSINDKGNPCITTVLAHKSGEWVRSLLTTPPEEAGIKALGSAFTYLRRYAICAMAGVAADDDDDGSAATGDEVTKAATKARPARNGAAALEQSERAATKPATPPVPAAAQQPATTQPAPVAPPATTAPAGASQSPADADKPRLVAELRTAAAAQKMSLEVFRAMLQRHNDNQPAPVTAEGKVDWSAVSLEVVRGSLAELKAVA